MEIRERPWDLLRNGVKAGAEEGKFREILLSSHGTKSPPDDIWFTLRSDGAGTNNIRQRVIILEMLVTGALQTGAKVFTISSKDTSNLGTQ